MEEAADIQEETREEDAPLDERILFFPEPCTRAEGSDCSRCKVACPAQAISFDASNLPAINAGACTRCSICIGVCDAFDSNRITTYDYAKRMVSKAKDTQRMLDETLSLLKPRERQLFDMRALMGLSIDEITQQTGIAKPSVTAMISAARKKVFTELKRRMKQ
jgi:Fe-S-cluster-containing hydrogenase component 2